MLLSHRRRQRSFLVAGEPQRPVLRRVIAGIVVLVLVYWIGSRILRLFGVGNPRERSAVMVNVDEGMYGEVSLDGEEWQRAESGMKIYWDDAVRTGPATRMTLSFFDGTKVRLDESSELLVYDSAKGKRESVISLMLERGTLWVNVPEKVNLSGSIVRIIDAPVYSYTLAPGTEGLVRPQSLMVFHAEGQGVKISARRHENIFVGEGQKWIVSGSGAVESDLYVYRSPLDAASARLSFITQSQTILKNLAQQAAVAAAALPSGEFLTITEPGPNAALEGGALTIRGTVTKDVARIEINGRDVVIDDDGISFGQTMVPPDGTEDVVVSIQAFDAAGTLLAHERRTVKRLPVVLTAPSIDAPAKTGETYRTQSEEFVLRGTAPRGATGIMVNDYLLQLFDPAKGTWSYLAAVRLANLKAGSNRFDVYALYPGPGGTQRKSEPATVTILLEEGPVGVVSAASAGSSNKAILNNAPLKPGSITITAPVAGTSATATGTGALIEGTTIPETDSVWVNDYRLQLYKPGKTTWNYIASPDLRNMKPGKNRYVIITRNSKGEVLDKTEYVIEYRY